MDEILKYFPVNKYFPVVLFIVLYKLVLWVRVLKILSVAFQIKGSIIFFILLWYCLLSCTRWFYESLDEILILFKV